MITIIVIGVWVAVIAFLMYINSQANKRTAHMNNQFTDANERSAQANAHARDWVNQLGQRK